MKIPLSFGLTTRELDLRAGSIGASTTRIIVNGSDEEKQALYDIHRAHLLGEKIEDGDDLSDQIYPQFGQYVEGFTAHWFELRTGLEISRRGEHVAYPEYPGFHCTLDGFIEELAPSEYDNRDDFAFHWSCPQPAKPARAVFEMKWRNARQFDAVKQVENFLPQLHQGMALTGAPYAVLATMVSDLKLYCAVVPYDRYYWAECMVRTEEFVSAVREGRPLVKIPALKAPIEGRVEVVLKTVDMAKDTSRGNIWAAFAALALSTAPNAAEHAKAKRHDKAKSELKKVIAKDEGVVFGNGVTAKKNKAGAISFEFDAAAIEAAQADARARAEAGVA